MINLSQIGVVFVFVVALLAACTDDAGSISASDCAEGTTLEGGKCVPDELACAEGTKLVMGMCVPDDDACGDGTVLDMTLNICVPDTSACAEGTTYDQGTKTCVPNSDILCGDGTSYARPSISRAASSRMSFCGPAFAPPSNAR